MQRILFVIAALAFTAGRAHAQTIERPVPFDSAHRVSAVTPALAERLHLTGPAWPVAGEFRDARLYSVEGVGGFVLVALHPDGTVARYPLSGAQRAELGAVIDAAMTHAGRPTGEMGSDILSEPAGASFVRRQTLLGATAYGALAASLSDDGPAAGALYLLVSGGSFFISYAASQNGTITRAQNHLASGMGVTTGLAGGLIAYSASGNGNDKVVRGAALGSAIIGTISGLNLGRSLSDAEAHAATTGISAGGLLGWAGSTLLGAESRGQSAAAAGGIIVGYPIGLAYPRSVSYNVTAGDVDAVGTTGYVGALVSGTFLPSGASPRATAAVLGAGYLAGLWVGDQAIARSFDLTESEANLAAVGALAGGLVGLAIPVLVGSDEQPFTVGSAAVGAVLGLTAVVSSSAGHHLSLPAGRAGGNSGANHSAQSSSRVSFTPGNLIGALGHVPGQYSLLHIGF